MILIEKLTEELLFLEKVMLSSGSFSPKFYNETVAYIHKLCAVLLELFQEGDIIEFRNRISVIREIHSKSSFIKRLQLWPEGYQGDYLTIEQLCSNNFYEEDYNLENYLERYALNSSIAQQHRNKVQIQSLEIIECLNGRFDPTILLCASGSAYDLRMVQDKVGRKKDFTIILNDLDEKALAFSKDRLIPSIREKIIFDHGNVISTIRNLNKNYDKIDLILFGGLFDYLSNKQISFSLKNAYEHLKKGGKILFTNIGVNNPYKLWIELCANWELIERSVEMNLNICLDAGIPSRNIRQYQDYSGLTNIVEIIKN